MPGKSWTDAALWTELERRGDDAEPARHAARRVLPSVETILRHAATGASDFTLHDADHSFRVAMNIARLLGTSMSDVAPSNLAHCLLAAYLHDIGMTPRLEHVRSLEVWLLTGACESLDPDEALAFQRWLDEHANGELGTPQTPPSPYELARRRELLTDYARLRHNAWSEQWMRAHLADDTWYPGWVDDLVLICRSHHEGYDRLRSAVFDPRLVRDGWLHLRHCACLLRVADVLDFDPERTPTVVFEHRDVRKSSAIFWAKDHQLAFVFEEDALVMAARPDSAAVHRAILETVDGVDAELALCRRLDDETHFASAPFKSGHLPHTWPWPSSVRRDIVPRNNAYIYIDGSFRPDTHRVLELLGGMALYRDEWVAFREVLQNAADAVRMRLASERLALPDPLDEHRVEALRIAHEISLWLHEDADGLWLVCRDTGVGLDERALRDRFLVGGQRASGPLVALRRECEAAGFPLERSAHFGIGVLSYFLLAQRMELRSWTAPNVPGIHFVIGGLQDFGELRPAPSESVGTELRLLINPEVSADRPLLTDLVRRFVRHMPCRLVLHEDGGRTDYQQRWHAGAEGTLRLPHSGWEYGGDVLSPSSYTSPKLALGRPWPAQVAAPSGESITRGAPPHIRFISPEQMTSSGDIPASEIMEFVQPSAIRALPDTEDTRLHWYSEEGDLPDRLGWWRVDVPYWETPSGASLIYPDDLGAGVFLVPNRELYHAWSGFAVSVRTGDGGSDPSGPPRPDVAVVRELAANLDPRPTPTRVLVDWLPAAGQLTVDRYELTLNPSALHALDWLRDREREVVQRATNVTAGGQFAALQESVFGAQIGDNPHRYWLVHDALASWRAVPSPSVLSRDLPATISRPLLGEAALPKLPPVRCSDKHVQFARHPHALGVLADDSERITGILPLVGGTPPDPSHVAGGPIRLPDEWRDVVGLTIDSTHYVNLANALVAQVDEESWTMAERWLVGNREPLTSSSKGQLAAAMLIRLLGHRPEAFGSSDVVSAMWLRAMGHHDGRVWWILSVGGTTRVRELDPRIGRRVVDLAELPTPSRRWWVSQKGESAPDHIS